MNMYGAYLPVGAPLDSPPEDWTIIQAPLVEQPAGEWDGAGAETPSHVYGLDESTGEWQSRIYYRGYPSGAVWNNEGPVQVGYLYWDGSIWQRYGPPVLTAEHDFERWGQYSFLGEPTARYFDGGWHIWYLAGIPPNLVHATSTDGRTWIDRRIMWAETATNLDVIRVGDHYEPVPPSVAHAAANTTEHAAANTFSCVMRTSSDHQIVNVRPIARFRIVASRNRPAV